MPKIDLCTVNYNTRPLVQRQIDSLNSDYDEQDFTFTIADNGSSDDSVEFLRHLDRPHFLKGIIFNENIGFARACNQLGARTTADIIGFLNADVWLTSSDIEKIVDSFDKHPEAAIIGPKQRDERGRIRHAGIVGTNSAPKHRGWAKPDLNDNLFRDFKEMVTVSGSAYFIRRSVWDELTNHPDYRRMYPDVEGAFLPTPHYYEETWVSYFARHLGHKVFYDGSISIGHSWHASHPQGSNRDRMFPISQKMFRQACDKFGIEHD